jgi:adenylate cyclase, class 2
MQEIEAKILEIDQEAIIAKLIEHGAKLVFDGTLIADFFNTPKGFRLRLRSDGTKHVLTYKRKVNTENANVKSAEELETEISSPGNLQKIFADLDIVHERRVTKHRTTYAIGKVHFEIDTYDAIPTFLEIEAPTSEEIVHWAEMLGYSEEDLTPMTMRQLEEHYNVHIW